MTNTSTTNQSEGPSGCLGGSVALVTGAARGVGRAIAQRLAKDGADIIALDVCDRVGPTRYPVATTSDLDETVRLVAALGSRVVARQVDVRDAAGMLECVAEAEAQLGGVDIAVANAGVVTAGRLWELEEAAWRAVLDTNLTGVWTTLKAVVPGLISRGRGGSIVVVNSVAGLKGLPGQAHYSAAKHGAAGLAKAAAVELGPYGIRVNSVHAWAIRTAMVADRTVPGLLADTPSYAASYSQALSEPRMCAPEDVAEAVRWLASPDSRCVTGAQLPVDMGANLI